MTLKITYLPTKFSKTEDFPADWPPTTAICGKSMTIWVFMAVKASCMRLMMGISPSIPRLPGAALAMMNQVFYDSGFRVGDFEGPLGRYWLGLSAFDYQTCLSHCYTFFFLFTPLWLLVCHALLSWSTGKIVNCSQKRSLYFLSNTTPCLLAEFYKHNFSMKIHTKIEWKVMNCRCS